MDRKSIPVIVLCFAFIIAWQMWLAKKYPNRNAPPVSTNAVAQAQPSTTTETSTAAAPVTPTLAPDPTPKLVVAADAVEQTIVLSNDEARYTFTTHGGGLKEVELLHYPETTARRSKYQPLTNGLATLNTEAPVPVLAVLGGAAIQGDGIFTLKQSGDNIVRASKTLTNGLELVKEFRLGSNYVISTSVRIENTGGEAVALPAQEWVVGTATPMAADDKGLHVGVMWYNGAKKKDINAMWFENRTLGCFPGVPRSEFQAGTSNVVWVAPHNQFFTLIAMPETPANEVVVRPVELPRLPDNGVSAQAVGSTKGFQAALVYPTSVLAPGQSVERKVDFFIGPKEYQTLARIASRFNNNADLVMDFGWAGFFSKALLLGMNWLHSSLKLSYGWAIIAITLIIKTLFWPLTTASTRSMKRMAALQPQMKAMQEKYKDDPVKMNKKMMEMWKEHKVSPVGGCLPMLIQMPVFIGFFFMIQSAIELRGASWLWVADLSKPDTLFYIPGINFPFNLLPLLMGVTMLWQSHLTPASPGMDPMQQKMMRYMPLIFLVILYNYSSGLALYWTVNNLLTILQTKITKAKDPVPVAAPALTPPPKKWK